MVTGAKLKMQEQDSRFENINWEWKYLKQKETE